MKKSSLMHGVSIVFAITGFLSLVAAWFVDEQGLIFGLPQALLIVNAIVFELISVSGGVCALYRRQLESEGK